VVSFVSCHILKSRWPSNSKVAGSELIIGATPGLLTFIACHIKENPFKKPKKISHQQFINIPPHRLALLVGKFQHPIALVQGYASYVVSIHFQVAGIRILYAIIVNSSVAGIWFLVFHNKVDSWELEVVGFCYWWCVVDLCYGAGVRGFNCYALLLLCILWLHSLTRIK
jgi:hypothetical protein